MDEENLEEFCFIDDLSKFNLNSKLAFYNGNYVSSWFKRNKKEILSRDDKYCRKIKADYKKYLELSERNKIVNEHIAINEKIILSKELAEYPDLEKFDINSKIKFKNGTLMSVWFARNLFYILDSKNEVCMEVSKQYKIWLKNKADKEKLKEKKYKQYFFLISGITKFDPNGKLTFSDGTIVNDWFYNNKKDILNSEDMLDQKIKSQYYNYLDFCKLSKEFLQADLEKFDPFGYVKFKSGAIMNFWWESNMKIIMELNDLDFIKIKNQYTDYVSKCNTDEENKLIKK